MRPLPPSRAAREYLDRAIFEPVAGPVQRRPNSLALGAAVAVVLLVVGALLASIARAQEPMDSCIDPTLTAATLICEGVHTREAEWRGESPVGESETDRGNEPHSSALAARVTVVCSGIVLAVLLTIVYRRGRVSIRNVAAESRIGGRRSLEDRSEALVLARRVVAVVLADGLGGHLAGARAAAIAVSVARERLEALGRESKPSLDTIRDVVRGVFARVNEALALEDSELGLMQHGIVGLRTTLLIAVRIGDDLVVAGIGDGGVFIREPSGEVVTAFTPQRGEAANVVAASLGPVAEGEPRVASYVLAPGDVVIAGTDGLVDRVSPDFFRRVGEAACRLGAPGAVRLVLDELLTGDDAACFDDNLSLAIIVPCGAS